MAVESGVSGEEGQAFFSKILLWMNKYYFPTFLWYTAYTSM